MPWGNGSCGLEAVSGPEREGANNVKAEGARLSHAGLTEQHASYCTTTNRINEHTLLNKGMR